MPIPAFTSRPGVRVSVGQTREELLSSERENTTTYGLVTADEDWAGLGRLRVFNMLKKPKTPFPMTAEHPKHFSRPACPSRSPICCPPKILG